jgi:hypothetical protein
MSLHKHVVRNWSMSLVLLMAPLARADKKPSSSPPPKPAAAPAAHPPANANANAIRSQHPTTSAPGTKFGTHTTPHTVPGAHTSPSSGSHPGFRGTTTTRLQNGTTVRFAPGGQIRSIHTANGVTINRTVTGQRTIVTARNGRTLVSTGPHGGYMQRPYLNRNGRMYLPADLCGRWTY